MALTTVLRTNVLHCDTEMCIKQVDIFPSFPIPSLSLCDKKLIYKTAITGNQVTRFNVGLPFLVFDSSKFSNTAIYVTPVA